MCLSHSAWQSYFFAQNIAKLDLAGGNMLAIQRFIHKFVLIFL